MSPALPYYILSIMILRLRALCPNKTVEMKILTARIIRHMKRGVLSRLRTGLLLGRTLG